MSKDITIFEFLKAITYTKKDLRKDERFDKSYNVFMINRFFSQHPKTIFLSNFISRFPDIPKELQYEFYSQLIEKENIYFNYQKKELTHPKKVVNIIKRVYEVGEGEAVELLKILSEEQIEQIERAFGGRNK